MGTHFQPYEQFQVTWKANLGAESCMRLLTQHSNLYTVVALALPCVWLPGNQQNEGDTMAAGILPSVLPLLMSDHPKLLDAPTGLMFFLTLRSKQNSETIFATDILPILVGLFDSDQPVIVAQAAMTLVSLIARSPQHISAVLATGNIPILLFF